MSARTLPAPRRKSRLRLSHIMTTGLVLLMAMMFVPTSLLVALGFLPTVAAFIFDQDPKRSITTAVGLMNGSGTVPFVIELWRHGQTMDRSIALLHDPVTWLVMYGAASIGWLICFIVPHAVQLVLAQRARLQIAAHEDRQAELRKVWGEEIMQKPASPSAPRS